MHSAINIIVLCSSPERNAICTPPRSEEDAETILRQSTRSASLSPVPSPSELFRLPSHSRYFATPDHSRSRTRDRTTQEAHGEPWMATDSNAGCLEDKQKRRGRKPKANPQATLRELDRPILESEGNALIKPKRTTENQTDGGTRGKKLKNKTIIGKVGKAGTANPKEAGAKLACGQPTSNPSHAPGSSKGDCDNGDLKLEPAVKRRLDWTPTKDFTTSVIELKNKEDIKGRQSGLGALLSRYEYEGIAPISNSIQMLADNGPTKRRRIELVDSRFLPLQPNPPNNVAVQSREENIAASNLTKKPKTRAKRFTTLTARVTASYSKELAECPESTERGVLTIDGLTAAETIGRKSKRKAGSISGFKVPRTIVLSPEEAVKSLHDQDLVFGTCSQLEREDSPDLLRETQIALQESEKEWSSASSSRLNQDPKAAHSSTAISRFTTPRNLWSVGARDTQGLLIDDEAVELVDTPVHKAIPSASDHGNGKENELREISETRTECDMLLTETSALCGAPTDEELRTSATQTIKSLTGGKAKAASKHPMPHYSGFTDIELAQEVKRYGLKAIKNRKKMIEILEKCWAAKNGPSDQGKVESLQHKETTTPTPTASEPQKTEKRTGKLRAAPQKKAKAHSQPSASRSTKGEPSTTTTTRAVKQPATDLEPQRSTAVDHSVHTESGQPSQTRPFIDVVEIQDSEDELIPSPSKLQSQHLVLPREHEQELPTSTIPSSPSHCAKLPDITEQITKAVREQPRQGHTGTRIRPTWHEKILMYDPIYLEDFTAWLNTEGLGRVNEDREVSAGLVRQWCESKGICCCFKVKTAGHF